jgi:hypothetical protein
LYLHQNGPGIGGERRPQHEADHHNLNRYGNQAILAGVKSGAFNPRGNVCHLVSFFLRL